MTTAQPRILSGSQHSDQRYERETLVFSASGRVVLNRFSATDCEIVMDKGVELLAVAATFRGCRFDSRSGKPSYLEGALVEACAFNGSFEAWQFGGRRGEPSVIGCDFGGALLNDCEFYECNVRESTFHGWPIIVFVEPDTNKSRFLRAPWPKTSKAQIFAQTLVLERRYPCAGFTIDANRAAKWMESTPEELRLVAEDLGDLAIF